MPIGLGVAVTKMYDAELSSALTGIEPNIIATSESSRTMVVIDNVFVLRFFNHLSPFKILAFPLFFRFKYKLLLSTKNKSTDCTALGLKRTKREKFNCKQTLHPKNLCTEKGNELKEQTRIDETDAIILKMLLVNSRTSLTEIAKSCKITVGAVRMRIMRLKKDGVIKGEVVLVNPHSLGYKCIVDLGIKTPVEHEKEVADFLRDKLSKANVVGAFAKYNVFAVAPLKNIHELAGLVEDLESPPSC